MSKTTNPPTDTAITINGVPLTSGEAMTIRVALEVFAQGLDPYGDDTMGVVYLEQVRNIRGLWK